MEFPVKFPSETDVILEDVARFRALTPGERFRSLQDLLDAGDLILQQSPKAAWAKRYAEEQELLAQRAIREFLCAMDTDAGPLSRELVRAVELLSDAFAIRSIRHALIGGLATSLRGRPRFTRDVDFLLDVPQLALRNLLDDLLERGFSLDPAIVIAEYVREHITAFSFGPVRIDWLKPMLPLYFRALADAQPMDWSEGHSVHVATADGLILTKMVAFRPQDQMDIETLLTANRDTIDTDIIRAEWSPFATSEPERTAWLEESIARRVVGRE